MNATPTTGQANPYSLFTYDANGVLATRDRRDNNLVAQKLWLWWDADDRLRKATTTSDPNGTAFFQATYDGDGLRKAKDDTRTGVLTHTDFSFSPFGLLWGNYTTSSLSTTYTPGFGQRTGGTDSFLQTDWLGSTRYATGSSGGTVTAAQSYDAFGRRDAQAVGSPNHPTDLQWAGGWGYQTEWSEQRHERAGAGCWAQRSA